MTTAHDTIADRVATLQAGMATQLPPDVGAAFAAEQAGLSAAGIPAAVTAVETPMPDAELLE